MLVAERRLLHLGVLGVWVVGGVYLAGGMHCVVQPVSNAGCAGCQSVVTPHATKLCFVDRRGPQGS
jgi:hypothetical protein